MTWSLMFLFSLWVLLDVLVLHFTSGMARSSFDAMVRARLVVAVPDPRIVIVDIDEASLARMAKEFGRWPWPRDTLATLLDFVENQQPAAIAWDIVFSDADRLSPGGDAAFNAAVARSPHSHFSVVRLPVANDGASRLTRDHLPGLWTNVPSTGLPSTLAVIPPILSAVAGSRMGFNNGYPDSDGVLRRYRYLETLPDGSQIQSLAASVANSLVPSSGNKTAREFSDKDELIAWRKVPRAYPRISFADVFAVAEGSSPLVAVPSFKGKVVVIGSTAASLHDIHPTPLSPVQAGVESLATAIDNAMNQRQIRELSRWEQATLTIALCFGIGLWVQFRGVDSLAPALLALPVALLGVGYFSLNGAPLFLDLHLAAALALLFLGALRYWNGLRRNYWRSPPSPTGPMPLVLWPLRSVEPWGGAWLDQLIETLEQQAASCRIIVADASVSWPASLRWPEIACHAAVVGPQDELMGAKTAIEMHLSRQMKICSGEPVCLGLAPTRDKLISASLVAWAGLQA